MIRSPFRGLLVVAAFSAVSFGSTVTYTEDSSVTGGCANAPLTGSCTVVVDPVNNPLRSAWDVLAFSTTGEIMNGMLVTVTFSDGTKETATWTHTGAAGDGTGAASVTTGTHDWSLTQSGDTFTPNNASGFFTLTNNTTATGTPKITDIVLDGSAALYSNCPAGSPAIDTCSTLFDRLSNPDTSTGATSNEQTPDSHRGLDLQIDGGNGTGAYNITVTYSDEFRDLFTNACYTTGHTIAENTVAPCGDTWQKLEAAFTGGTGVAKGTPFLFDTDTDTSITGPEPSSLALFGVGLLCIVTSVCSRNRIPRVFVRSQKSCAAPRTVSEDVHKVE
jgi:hypothetical protein